MDTGSGRRPVSRTGLSSPPGPQGTPPDAIRARALALGFDTVGFASAESPAQAGRDLVEFLKNGFHGDMTWMENRAGQRVAPNALWPEAKSVISVGMNYGPAADPLSLTEQRDHGIVSVYARGRDYHDVMKGRLRQLARWIHETYECEVKLFVDTAPVMEKPLAQRAGIGWQGKHTNLVSREFGSWLFLGEIFTTLELEPDAAEPDRCGSCEACLVSCPTSAFPAPGKIDARRCISYLTIEHKGHIPRELRAKMGNRIYGCDDCLAACPWNKFGRPTETEALFPRIELDAPKLADLLALDDACFREVFAGSPVKRTGRDRFLRNVLIACGNSQEPRFAPRIETLLGDPSPLVRAAAIWALGRLLPDEDFTALRDRYRDTESDPEVQAEWG